MRERLYLVRIDSSYCDYLRKFDSKVPYNNHKKDMRPFVGILFQVEQYMYFAPLSSPKPKHARLVQKLDFLKLDGGKLGVINFNNMIPVSKRNIIKVDLSNGIIVGNIRYTKLLKEQLFWMNRNKQQIYGRANRLYQKYCDGTLHKEIMMRCCNFKLLEKKWDEYNTSYCQI